MKINQINPKKLLLSKWTSISPKNKERHFIVSEILLNDDKEIIACSLEAVINKNMYDIEWQQLKNSDDWQMGWK